MKIKQGALIANYRKFKVKFSNDSIRYYEYDRENKGIFFYNVFDEKKKKLGFMRVGINQKFVEKFPIGEAYTIK